MQKAQGFVENGNLVVTVGGVSAAQKAQGSYPSAQVTVYNAGTLTPSTIYSDNSSTPKANPFTSATNGYFFFYAANGRYDVTFTGGGLSAPLTFGDVLLADPFAAGGAVTSFNGRTGVVVPASGDYSLTQITGFPTASAPLQYLRSKATSATVFEFVNQPILLATDYTFTAQAPGGSLAIGSNTITLTPVPLGVNGTDSNHYLYVSAGTGTAEAVLITGGTAVAGTASGTVIVTCANTHSGAWTLQSATAGLSEAIWALPAAGGVIQLASGSASLHAPVYNRAIPMWMIGQYETTTYNVAADFPLTAPGVFNWTTNPGGSTVLMPGGMSGITLFFIQPDSTNVATYTHWPPAFNIASTHRPYFQGINVQAAWDGWKSSSNDGLTVKDVTMSFFHRGFDLDGQTDTVRLENIHLWPTGLTNNQNTAFTAVSTANVGLYFGNVQNFNIVNYATIAGGGAANMHTGTGGSPSGDIVNADFDTVGGYVQSDGNIGIANSQMSLIGTTKAFTVNGGLLTLTDPLIYLNGGVTGSAIVVNISAPSTGAAALVTPGLVILGGEIVDFESGASVATATTSGSFTGTAQVKFIGMNFDRPHDVIVASASIIETAGTGTMEITAIGTRHTAVVSGSGTAFSFASDNYHVLIGNYGGGWGITLPGSPTKITLVGNTNFAASGNVDRLLNALRVVAKLSPSTFVPLQTENYIASETGANNAIAGALVDAAGVNVPLAAGLKVSILLAHSLQAGANTFALNAGTAKSMKKATNPANDIGTAFVSGSIVTAIYDGTVWQVQSQ